MKQRWFLLPVLLILIFLLCFPQIAFVYSRKGLLLWFQTLLPSLLPFMIISNILIKTNKLEKWISIPKKIWKIVFGLTPNGAYALFLGLFCGYPMGAKVTADLYKDHRISKAEANYLLTFSNHPSPVFISSFILTEALHREDMISISYMILYSSSYLCSFIFRMYYRKEITTYLKEDRTSSKKETSSHLLPGEILDASIMNGFEGITKLGGYIILFSVCSGMIQACSVIPFQVKYFLLGITELTTGISAISTAPFSFTIRYAFIMAITAFGGLCTIAQTKSMLSETSLSIKPYIAAKMCNFTITLLLVLLIV